MTLPPGWRKLSLAVHLAVSVGWLGAIAAYLVLDVATATSADVHTLRAAYAGMDRIARAVIVPLAVASLVSGIVVSLGSRWGLLRHYWVVVSLILTAVATGVLLLEVGTIRALAAAAEQGGSAERLRALDSTLAHSVGGIVVLLVILVLNVYKPQGLTRYGWRRQRADRGAV